MDRNHVEQLIPAALFDHLGELLARTRVLTDDDGAAFVGGQDVPALLLAEAAILVLAGVRVVGMHLDGQVGGGVDDLHEQRKHVALAVAEQLAVVGPQPGEGLAGGLARAMTSSPLGCAEMAQHSPTGPSGMSYPKSLAMRRPPQILPLKSGTSLMIESIAYILSCESTFGSKARTPDPTSIVLTPHYVR